MQSQRNLLTPEQAAQLLGVTPGTLAVWRCTGRYDLPFVKVGSLVRYSPGAIERFINERTRSHTGQDGA